MFYYDYLLDFPKFPSRSEHKIDDLDVDIAKFPSLIGAKSCLHGRIGILKSMSGLFSGFVS